MKIVKGIMTVLAWVGIALMIWGLWDIIARFIFVIKHPFMPPVQSPFYGFIFYLFGEFLALIGGIIARLPFVYPILIITGIIFSVLFFISAMVSIHGVISVDSLIMLLPGIAGIIGGWIIYLLRHRFNSLNSEKE
jgi:hypothetical protein